MIRAVGSALIVMACAGLGFQIAKAYRDRPKQLAELANAIRMLRAEIEFSLTPLPHALARVGGRTSKTVETMFENAAQNLTRGDTVPDAFAKAAERAKVRTALRKDDFDALMEFASSLGSSDLAHQSQHLDASLARLASLEKEARDLQRKNERMWQYLGILTGLLLVIVLY